ncbi:MAG: tripartite tricarboxylate transporter TctB family protein [Burkholderiales bacterium]
MRRDTISGCVCLVISIVLLGATRGLPEASILVPIGPGIYPRVVLAITAVLSIIVIATGLRARKAIRSTTEPVDAGARNYPLVIAAFAVFGLYTLLLPIAGFRIATFLFVAALQGLLEPPRTVRALSILIGVALATSLVSHFIFERNLGVLLPRGSLTGL